MFIVVGALLSMIQPARRRAISLASRRWHICRFQHTEPQRTPPPEDTSASTSSEPPLTGSAKLFADAIAEESVATSSSSRDHLPLAQGPVWNGEETQSDAVLRMLVDAHKPLRSGSGIKHDAADDKIKGWMRGLKLEARMGASSPSPAEDIQVDASASHRTTIPPHLHRPWHSTYTGEMATEEAPRIKYGTFIRKNADGAALANLMELQLPPNADSKLKARARALHRAGKVVRRFAKAREGAIDYKLGLNVGEGGQVVEAGEEETFQGNRQVKGSSVLGTQRGGASGLKAWAGLVEDRIQVSHIVGVLLLRIVACTR